MNEYTYYLPDDTPLLVTYTYTPPQPERIFNCLPEDATPYEPAYVEIHDITIYDQPFDTDNLYISNPRRPRSPIPLTDHILDTISTAIEEGDAP